MLNYVWGPSFSQFQRLRKGSGQQCDEGRRGGFFGWRSGAIVFHQYAVVIPFLPGLVVVRNPSNTR